MVELNRVKLNTAWEEETDKMQREHEKMEAEDKGFIKGSILGFISGSVSTILVGTILCFGIRNGLEVHNLLTKQDDISIVEGS